ncbi:hypothetical protein PHYC_01785 [Phycisphaerales bacterium]|nr:hypothetical protein PHYC_01785 [Phycisphaerales bacterium]
MVLVSTAISLAQPVTVDILRQGGGVETFHFQDGESIILSTISELDSVTLIRAYSTNPDNSANVGEIQLSGTRQNPALLDVLIGREGAINPEPADPLLPAAANWDGLLVDGGLTGKVRVSGAILGDLTGLINVGEIVRLQCGGDVTGGIIVTNPGMAFGTLVARAVLFNSPIILQQESLGVLETTIAPAGNRDRVRHQRTARVHPGH